MADAGGFPRIGRIPSLIEQEVRAVLADHQQPQVSIADTAVSRPRGGVVSSDFIACADAELVKPRPGDPGFSSAIERRARGVVTGAVSVTARQESGNVERLRTVVRVL